MSKLNIYNKKLAILNKSSICPFTLEMFIYPFTNLYVQNVSVHRNLCQVSSLVLSCQETWEERAAGCFPYYGLLKAHRGD